MARFVPLMIALIMLGMFSIALITGGTMFQLQNGAPEPLINDSSVSAFYQSINSSLYSSAAGAQTANEAFSNSSIQTTGVTPYISALGGIWKILKASPVVMYNLVVDIVFGKIFGDSATIVIVSALSAILVLILISAIVYLLSRGEGG